MNSSELPLVHEQSLENGLCHIHIEHPLKKIFFIGFYVKAGKRWEEPGQEGISHFLEHMMFRGSKKFPSFLELAKVFESFGGEWNAATSHEHTEYTYSGLSSSAKPLIELFSNFIWSPLLLDEEKEREVILREIEDELNEFNEFIDLDYQSMKLAWPGEGFCHPITGTKASLKKINRAMLERYYKKNFHKSNLVLCTSGGEEAKEIMAEVKKNFGRQLLLQSGPEQNCRPKQVQQISTDFPKEFKFFSFRNSDNQDQVQINFLCQGEWSEASKIYHLMSHIFCSGFSSRMMRRLREDLGLLYSIDSASLQLSDRGLFSFNYGVLQENFFIVLEELLKILQDFCNHGPTEEELIRAQKQEILELESFSYDFDSLSYSLARQKLWSKNINLLTKVQEIKKISAEQIKQEANRLFKKDSCVFIVMGEDVSVLRTKVDNLVTRYL